MIEALLGKLPPGTQIRKKVNGYSVSLNTRLTDFNAVVFQAGDLRTAILGFLKRLGDATGDVRNDDKLVLP